MMKRNEEEAPRFDDIVFGNRNREYGAYMLRKRYKTVTSLSTLGTLVISAAVIILLSATAEPATGIEGKKIIVIVQPENYKAPQVEKPEVKPLRELPKPVRNIVPDVVDDTLVTTSDIPITDVLIGTTDNGDLNDTITYVKPADNIVPPEKEIFIRVEEMPEYPGGDGALIRYIGHNLVYPREAADNNIEGRVFLKFVITEDGSVGEIVLLKGVDPLLDQEAVRVISTLPKFKPGKQNGIPVNVWYSVPVLFRLEH